MQTIVFPPVIVSSEPDVRFDGLQKTCDLAEHVGQVNCRQFNFETEANTLWLYEITH